MNRRTHVLWKHFEQSLGFKFPQEIKLILNICGFDSELSLKEINEKTIESIEQTVTENLNSNNLELVSGLKGSVYEGKPLPFNFLLGHRVLILSIPEKVQLLQKSKSNKRFPIGNASETENVEKNRSVDAYKKALLLKLKNYAKKFSLNFEVKENHIKNFSQVNNVIRCNVKCCFCDTRIPCTFITYWNIGNLTKHIRNHPETLTETSNKDQVQKSAENSIEKSVTEDTASSASAATTSDISGAKSMTIERVRKDVLDEVV